MVCSDSFVIPVEPWAGVYRRPADAFSLTAPSFRRQTGVWPGGLIPSRDPKPRRDGPPELFGEQPCIHGERQINESAMRRQRRRPIMHRALWIIQGLLALFFALASGAPKLFLSPESLPPMPIELPRAFMLFIGVAELLGALGLILPGIFRIRPGLTPLAAVGLTLISIGATGYWLLAGDAIGNAAFAAVIALICAFVAYGRSKLAPHRESSRQGVPQPAA
jgi:hypothetical protein